MSIPKYHEYILEAYRRGYRMESATGNIISVTGKIRETKLFDGQRYPSFAMTVIVDGKKKTASFPVHKFAAYCYFGADALKLQVRHLDSNTCDASFGNILLGTRRDNEMDKPANIRSRSAKAARASQGISGVTQKLAYEDAQVIKLSAESSSILAKRYGVSRSTVQLIKKGVRTCYE